jgi:hypothetical protein
MSELRAAIGEGRLGSYAKAFRAAYLGRD